MFEPLVVWYVILFHSLAGIILQQILRGARLRAATVFESCLHQVQKNVNNSQAWLHLLLFPICFFQPHRGGKRHSLTPRILAQLQLFENGGFIVSAHGFRQERKGGGVKRQSSLSRDVEVANRCSMNLGEGNIPGLLKFCVRMRHTDPQISSP